MKTLKISLFKSLLFFIFYSSNCLGQLPPSDTPYFKQKITDKLELFFSEDYKEHSLFLHQYTFALNKELGRVFPLSPYYRKNSIVFVSPRKQITNGTTFIQPFPSIFIYSSPAQILDSFSIFNWGLDSLTHEITHLYQINSQTKYSYWLSHIFPFASWFVYPNIYSHNLILEGNAVLHESIYGSGGRLFSGWVRALVFAQLKSGISLRRLINKYNDSFSGLEKYIHGGYFYSYLHSKHTLKDLNKFFYFNSKNTFLPIGTYSINRSFKKSLNTDFYSSLKNYKEYYKPQAIKQKSSKEKALITSSYSAPLNSDDKNIFFLIAPLKSSPSLVILDKETQTISVNEKDLPLGKIFLIDGIYYSASTNKTSTTLQKFTLFKDGYKPLKKYLSQYVMDLSPTKVLSLDTQQSLDQIRLLVNNKFYDNVHSSSIMNHKGSIYYFKNKGHKRILYKNKIPIWSYQGYYGFPVEADQEGVYFIAATKYGSSLFLHSKGSTYRLSESDTIIAARKINKTNFLISEVTSKNYEYKIIKTTKTKEIPYLYKYAFKKKKINAQQVELKDHSPSRYYSLNNLKFQNLSFLIGLASSKLNQLKIDTTLSFADSLNYSKFILHSSIDKKRNLFSLDYSNEKYRSSFQIIPVYEKGILSLKSNEETIDTFEYLNFLKEKDIYEKWFIDESILLKKQEIPYQSRAISFNINHPIYDTKRWNVSFLKKISLGQKRFNNNTEWINYLNYFGNLNFAYSKKYSQSFSENKKIKLRVLYDVIHIQNDESNYRTYLTSGANFFFSKSLGKEIYITTSGSIRRGLWSQKPRRIFTTESENVIFNFHSFKQTVRNFNRISFSIQKAINQSLYPIYIPLALSRWAPFTGLSLVSFEDTELLEKDYHYLLNAYLGWDFELMANYKAPAHLSFSLGYIWKWQNQFGENKAHLHGEVYLKARL